jgi:photosynthetic reaction center cytochrome c subunit
MTTANRTTLGLTALAASVLLTGCWERPPIDTVQRGYRGTGMLELFNPRIQEQVYADNQAPEPAPPASGGPPARTVYKNLQVLGDLDVVSLTRLMTSITAWVAPQQGCTYCHGENLADDGKYTKRVARRMLQMTQNVNSQWKSHVAQTGVTCYTCHRGQPVPPNTWFIDPDGTAPTAFAGWRYGQNQPAAAVNLSSLPKDPFTVYLQQKGDVKVAGTTALPIPGAAGASIQQTEWTYGLMMHFSQALGVNCTYCHNTRSFSPWDMSTPQRANAWYGIRMVRSINNDYIEPLKGEFPPERLGPTGDVPKTNCSTCHNGVFKPLYGAPLAQAYPALLGDVRPPTPAPEVVGEVLILYFAVDSAQLHGAAPDALTLVAEKLKANPKARASISGYHSASGERSHNQELAKQRAVAIAAVLEGAGIGADRVLLVKPLVVQGNVAGEDPAARRVEVVIR